MPDLVNDAVAQFPWLVTEERVSACSKPSQTTVAHDDQATKHLHRGDRLPEDCPREPEPRRSASTFMIAELPTHAQARQAP